jgi:hypothetical protein
MDAVRLSRITTPLTVAIVGLVAGHALLPYAGAGVPTTIGRRLAFWALLLAAGAFRGWRDADARDERGARVRWRVGLTALAAAGVGLVAYWVAHGAPAGL